MKTLSERTDIHYEAANLLTVKDNYIWGRNSKLRQQIGFVYSTLRFTVGRYI
jgi:hypothetical protein